MNSYSRMMVCGVVLGLSGCATMAGWTPDQTAAFVGAMQTTANAVDPYEYAGPRQPVEPPIEAPPVAQAYNGRAFTPKFPQPAAQVQPVVSPEPVGANIPTPVHCWVAAFNTIECD